MITKRHTNKLFRKCGSELSASLSPFKTLALNTAIFGAVSILIHFANEGMDSTQMVSILVAVSPSPQRVEKFIDIVVILVQVHYDSGAQSYGDARISYYCNKAIHLQLVHLKMQLELGVGETWMVKLLLVQSCRNLYDKGKDTINQKKNFFARRCRKCGYTSTLA